MACDELIVTNKALVDRVTLLKLENGELTKSLDKLRGKQPLSSES